MHKKTIRKLTIFGIMAVLFSVAVLMLFMTFSHKLHDDLAESTESYMREFTAVSAQSIDAQLRERQHVVENASRSLTYFFRDRPFQFEFAIDILRKLSSGTDIIHAAFANLDGETLTTTGVKLNVRDRDYFIHSLSGQTFVSTVFSRVVQAPVFITSAPFYKEGKIAGVVYFSTTAKHFASALKVPMMKGYGQVYVADMLGRLFFQPGAETSTPTRNIVEVLRNSNLLNSVDTDSAEVAFAEGRPFYAVYNLMNSGKIEHICCMPLQSRPNWNAVCIVSESAISDSLYRLERESFFLVVSVLTMLLCMGGYILHVHRERHRDQDKAAAEMKAVVSTVPGGFFKFSHDKKMEFGYVSPGFLNMLNCSQAQLKTVYDNRFDHIIYPDDLKQTMESIERQSAVNKCSEVEYRVIDARGCIRYFWNRAVLLNDEDGREWFNVIATDMTDQHREKLELKVGEEQYRILSEMALIILADYDCREKRLLSLSPEFEAKFGYRPGLNSFPQGFAPTLGVVPDDFPSVTVQYQLAVAGKRPSPVEIRMMRTNGRSPVWCQLWLGAVSDENGPIRLLAMLLDISRQKHEVEALKLKSELDPLTQLYNRGATIQAIDQIFKESPDDSHILILMDIDNFKAVNDNYGHVHGDLTLSAVACRLRDNSRSDDIIGRVGGDEFVLFFRSFSDRIAAKHKARQICAALRQISVPGCPGLQISGSLGIACSPENGNTYAELFAKADSAMYNAKHNGKDSHCFASDLPPADPSSGPTQDGQIS